MKKVGLISVLLVGVSFAAVGCASKQTTETPETAQTTQQMDSTSAQTSMTDTSAQTGVAVEADANMQQVQPAQMSPESSTTVEQPAAQ